MPTDKELKRDFKAKASADPDKYYATGVLKENGFMRKCCTTCKTNFWTVNADQQVCGDPSCSGGFKFIGNTPAKNKLDYIGVWKEFSKLFKKQGYTPIDRYPIAARWRDDAEFVQASIYDFQPYVVSGEVDPPANPLVVPQTCVRFNDIDNIGITGSHYSCFVMIGQHAFMPPEKWDQAKYFNDIYQWLKQGLGLPNNEITFHEDAWAGGGNFGPCMEYFSRGLELGNQVYMMYEVTPSGNKELKLKVLDMGMGHERNAWFTQGVSTSYETTFPTVVKHLKSKTGIQVDQDLMQRFLPYASYLNVDEVDDINKTWNQVADKVGVDVKELRTKITESAALYSVADHTRSLLIALSDGVIPSNVGGGYNLRVLLRRALGFIDNYGWDIYLPDVCKEHADYLKPLFPELSENIDQVTKILDVERSKYQATKQKTASVVSRLMNEDVTEQKLYELYDSQGIPPQLVAQEAKKNGKDIPVPDDFYAKITERHDNKEQEHATVQKTKLPLDGVADTKALYYHDYEHLEFTAKVIKIIDNNVILDQTYFYPTSGGQLHDVGTINGLDVVNIIKQGKVIVHILKDKPGFSEGEDAICVIDKDRRYQLAKHHTATHIVNAAAQRVLGNHVNQAGAKKDLDKATIDISHYQAVSEDELKSIESEANKIVNEELPVQSKFYPRTEAEQTFGVRIYQGGAVPGKELRIVKIPEVDVEACGGTHLKNTKEAGQIKLIKASKISDSLVRLTFTAGDAAQKELQGEQDILNKAAELLGCDVNQTPARAEELFSKWKKKVKKKKEVDTTLTSTEVFEGDVLKKLTETLRTQPDHVEKTIRRFLNELGE